MASWAAFEGAAPELAVEGKRLIYQYGVGLGFLATVRKDGAPRLHPICPIVAEGGLFAFINPSPKCHDLRRDGRFALHAHLPDDVDDEFVINGRATELFDTHLRERVIAAYHTSVPSEHALFTFDVERCLHAKYRQRGDWPPTYTTWTDPSTTWSRNSPVSEPRSHLSWLGNTATGFTLR